MDERTCTALRGSEQLHSVPSHLQLAANALGESLLPSSRPLLMSQALDQRPRGVGLRVFAWQETRPSPASSACDAMVPGALLKQFAGARCCVF